VAPQINLVHDHIGPSLQEYSEVMGRTLADTMKRAAKGVTRRVINLTPPASQGMEGAAAYRAGRAKIARQMSALLVPVKLKGRRKIPVVFGRRLRTAVVVATKEKHPDVAGLYRQNMRFLPTGLGARLKDYRGKKFWVSAPKFQKVLVDRQKAVGRLASGWAEGATALDVPLQAWIGRHGRGRGKVNFDLVTSRMRITVQNFSGVGLPANVKAEMQRRIGYAVQYQRNAMGCEVRYYAMKKAQEAGMKTRNFDALVPAGRSGRSDT
jgi:hypothetical protein